jgi:hypothetical protein
MEKLPPISQSQIFTLRIWGEDQGEGRTEWRGQAKHVSSGATVYFRSWEALTNFLIETLERDKGESANLAP